MQINLDILAGLGRPFQASDQRRQCSRDGASLPLAGGGGFMKRNIEGMDRGQGTLFPEHLEDWVG